jgi:hypothetical protein
MIVRKITVGLVVQEFDADTGRCLSQEFVAGSEVRCEDRQGNTVLDGDFGIDLEGLFHPLEMKSPEEASRGDPN